MLDLTFSIFSFYGAIVLFYRCVWQRSLASEKTYIYSDQAEKQYQLSYLVETKKKNIPLLLSSIEKLSYPNLEVIVVDDNSTDKTAEIASNYNCKIISLNGKTHIGQENHGRAKRVRIKRLGNIYLFTDADTLIKKDAIERSIFTWKQTI